MPRKTAKTTGRKRGRPPKSKPAAKPTPTPELTQPLNSQDARGEVSELPLPEAGTPPPNPTSAEPEAASADYSPRSLAGFFSTICSLVALKTGNAKWKLTEEEALELGTAAAPLAGKYLADFGDYSAEITFGLALVGIIGPRFVSDLSVRPQGAREVDSIVQVPRTSPAQSVKVEFTPNSALGHDVQRPGAESGTILPSGQQSGSPLSI